MLYTAEDDASTFFPPSRPNTWRVADETTANCCEWPIAKKAVVMNWVHGSAKLRELEIGAAGGKVERRSASEERGQDSRERNRKSPGKGKNRARNSSDVVHGAKTSYAQGRASHYEELNTTNTNRDTGVRNRESNKRPRQDDDEELQRLRQSHYRSSNISKWQIESEDDQQDVANFRDNRRATGSVRPEARRENSDIRRRSGEDAKRRKIEGNNDEHIQL